MDKIVDNHSITGNVLERELFYKIDDKIIKIKVDRNCNNYNANIKVFLIDMNNINSIELLSYPSEQLINKRLECVSEYEAIQLNNKDIERVLKDIQKILFIQ